MERPASARLASFSIRAIRGLPALKCDALAMPHSACRGELSHNPKPCLVEPTGLNRWANSVPADFRISRGISRLTKVFGKNCRMRGGSNLGGLSGED